MLLDDGEAHVDTGIIGDILSDDGQGNAALASADIQHPEAPDQRLTPGQHAQLREGTVQVSGKLWIGDKFESYGRGRVSLQASRG